MALLEALKSTILAVVRKKRKKERKKIIKKKSLYFWVTSCHAKKSGWRWGLVSQHQVEGPSEVVCQRAAALVLCQGQEEGQEQKQQEEQLQWQCCPAHSMQEGAHTSRALLKDIKQTVTQTALQSASVLLTPTQAHLKLLCDAEELEKTQNIYCWAATEEMHTKKSDHFSLCWCMSGVVWLTSSI